MSKVYMRAEDNEAGVTVEDDRSHPDTLTRIATPGLHLYVDNAEARAVVEGLLRRMWDRGEALNHSWFDAAYNRWHADKAKREGR